MEYELKALERIVSLIVHPTKLMSGSRDAAFIGKYKRLAHLEKERIKMQFIKAAFEPGGESRLELYYRQHQHSLIQLADDMYRATKRNTNNKLYKEVYLCVEFLLHFIEIQYPIYFDQDAKIPEALRWSIAPDIKGNILLIRSAFTKNGVADELIKIACHPLEDLLLPETIVTYSELKFVKELQRELVVLAKKKDLHNSTEQLCSLLLHLNYNSILFLNYYIEQICETGKGYSNTIELIEYYSIKLKFINQVMVKPGCVYKRGLSSLNEQVSRWLSEELYFLEKLQQFSQLPVKNAEYSTQKPKVHTSLSVAHLSLVIRVLLDANLIKNKNATDLLKRVASSFRTDMSEHISEDSLRNKFYNFDDNTVDQVKNVIKGLMGVVMRY